MRIRNHAVVLITVLLAIVLPSASFAAASRGEHQDPVAISFDTPASTPTPRPGAQRTPRPTRAPIETNEPAVAAAVISDRSTLVVGYREPGILGQAPLLLAFVAGYFDEVGLTDVIIVETPKNALAEVRRGNLDIAVIGAKQAAEANAEDEQLRAIAGYQNYRGESGGFGGDLLVATPGLAANEPSTIIAFLNAYIRALQDLSDPESAQAALEAIRSANLTVDPEVATRWFEVLAPYAPFDGGFGDASMSGGLGELETYLTAEDGTAADLDALIAKATLNLAQASLRMPPNPHNVFMGALVSDISVALPMVEGTTSPIVAANEAGFFEDVGFTSVEVMDVEQPLLGVLTGEVDFGVVSMTDAADGITQGLPIQAIAGHQNYGPDGAYGGDVVVATTDLIENEPAAVVAFLAAYIRALQERAEATNGASFAPFDGGFGSKEVGGGLGELSAYVDEAVGTPVDTGVLVAERPLEFAQASLGLPANPSTARDPVNIGNEEEGA